ncbi:MAG: MBL fold metallo-hydrolase [Phreatobacter sp.]|nr:MBL fold metallo-hydrolase [Phreatobacter sp.]
MKITVLGSGDAFGSGGRYSTCLHLTGDDGTVMLIDCGATSLLAMQRANIDRNAISTILLTHFHGDHAGGLPFFLLDALFESRRTAPLTIAGPTGVRERVSTITDTAFPGFGTNTFPFPITYVEVTPEAPAALAGAQVTAFSVDHDQRAGPCQGYRIARDGKLFAYSGDTTWTDTLLPLADGADVLLVECYTYDKPLKNHLDWMTLSARLPDLKAKRIILTHMGPQMLANRDKATVECAEDGLVILP